MANRSLVDKGGSRIDPKIVRLVKARQGFLCAHCGRSRKLEVHHLVPRGLAGGYRNDHPGNLIGLCSPCHKTVGVAGYSKSKFGKQDWRD